MPLHFCNGTWLPEPQRQSGKKGRKVRFLSMLKLFPKKLVEIMMQRLGGLGFEKEFVKKKGDHKISIIFKKGKTGISTS